MSRVSPSHQSYPLRAKKTYLNFIIITMYTVRCCLSMDAFDVDPLTYPHRPLRPPSLRPTAAATVAAVVNLAPARLAAASAKCIYHFERVAGYRSIAKSFPLCQEFVCINNS
ncbi:hypothetical protein F5878DRAFT_302169 [Lentinula raphanica]|uniref:Uncharacterized protein n=1 Tax=Lentinula raphanica TaxID=153919 RepID=A0AA38PIE5_9AGAR|nr:hypothetical protein F5878DRAFT_302169 [Lentinula raphanica]